MELKFRALKDDISDVKMVFGTLTYSCENVPRIFENKGSFLTTTCIKGTEGQFTGFIDKKGVEIYKGDILTWDFHSKKYEVIWHDGAYYLKNGNQHARLSNTSLNGYYVVGNVIQNPDLLLT